MIRPTILWVDLTQCERNSNSLSIGTASCCIHRILGAQGLGEIIRSVQPRAICFEFDYPPPAGLAILSEIKRSHPSIPIVMLTEPHSESLAVWALRARVWDYFVKPVSEAEILRSMMPLFMEDDHRDWNRRAPRSFIAPEHDILDKLTPLSLSRSERAILTAYAYVESRLEEKISERTVAKCCGLSTSCFSRTFKRINGLTFSKFILQTRVKKAIALLENKHASVTEVCHAVGFKNLSHFSSTFRACAGVSPVTYRARLRQRYVNGVSGGMSGTLRSHVLTQLAFALQIFELANAVI